MILSGWSGKADLSESLFSCMNFCCFEARKTIPASVANQVWFDKSAQIIFPRKCRMRPKAGTCQNSLPGEEVEWPPL